jgi:hypothetical protein
MRLGHVLTTSCLGIGLAVCLAGCPSGPGAAVIGETAPVSGKVTLDDKPFEGATVEFVPLDGSGNSGFGKTDAEGKYTVETQSGGEKKKGLAPGRYKIGVSKKVLGDGSPMPDNMSPNDLMMKGGMKEAAPRKTSIADSSGIDFTVPKEGGTKDIQLQSDPS